MQVIRVGATWLEDVTIATPEKADVRLALVLKRAHRFDGRAGVTTEYLLQLGLPAEIDDMRVDSKGWREAVCIQGQWPYVYPPARGE